MLVSGNLMRNLSLLLCLAGTLPQAMAWAAPEPTAALPTPRQKLPFEDDIIAFEEADKKNPPPLGGVLFIGSSNIRMWTTLAQDFPELNVLNRGFGGSMIENSVDFVDRITIPYKPRLIVLSAGTNDINNGHTPQDVLANFQKYVTKVHAALPKTRIAFLSINPSRDRLKRPQHVQGVLEANNLIAQWIRENDGKVAPLTFIDTYPYLLTPEGEPLPDIFLADQHHLNAEGYAALTALLRPQVLALAGVKAGAPKTPPATP
jgi:lysophospholipase L1-like esterase